MSIWKKLTKDERIERDRIVKENLDPTYGELQSPKSYECGGIASFDGLKPEGMRILIQKGYARADETQNDSPSIEEFTAFCEKHPGFTMHGYLVSEAREDCRVSVEGVIGAPDALDAEGVREFVRYFRFADEFALGDNKDQPYYCWYD